MISFESINGDAIIQQSELILFQAPIASLSSLELNGSVGDDIIVVGASIANPGLSYRVHGRTGFDTLRFDGESHLLDWSDVNPSLVTTPFSLDLSQRTAIARSVAGLHDSPYRD